MGCNSIFFEIEFRNNGKINISGITSTEMVCKKHGTGKCFPEKISQI